MPTDPTLYRVFAEAPRLAAGDDNAPLVWIADVTARSATEAMSRVLADALPASPEANHQGAGGGILVAIPARNLTRRAVRVRRTERTQLVDPDSPAAIADEAISHADPEGATA